MLERWAHTTVQPKSAQMASDSGLMDGKAINTVTGTTAAVAMDPTDTYLVIATSTMKMARCTRASGQKKPNRMPTPVAMPLPPWNLR